jgi:hypothetical protein
LYQSTTFKLEKEFTLSRETGATDQYGLSPAGENIVHIMQRIWNTALLESHEQVEFNVINTYGKLTHIMYPNELTILNSASELYRPSDSACGRS